MPELPEVETVKAAIAPKIMHQQLQQVKIFRPDCRYAFDKPAFKQLSNYYCSNVTRRGKLLMISFAQQAQQACVFVHLGMSGSLQLQDKKQAMQAYGKHDHLVFCFDSYELRYNDPRRFGWVDVRFDEHIAYYPFLQKLGVEPLSADFTVAHLYTLLQKRKGDIKAALLDQSLIAGLGNIYVCEALFMAKIHPKSSSCAIPKAKVKLLHDAIVKVLARAIAAGGSSIKDFKHSDGKLGYFQHQFQIYAKQGDICIHCGGNQHVEKCIQAARSSFYCKKCQKLYKSP